MDAPHWNFFLSQKHNTVQKHNLTSWGEGASLALVSHPSSDEVTIKIPYGVDALHWPTLHPIFSYWVG